MENRCKDSLARQTPFIQHHLQLKSGRVYLKLARMKSNVAK